jgi:hypothetical protein
VSLADQFEAESERDLTVLSALIRASWEVEFSKGYVRPALDLGLNRFEIDAAQETADSVYRLALDDVQDTHIWTRPNVEAGWEVPVTEKALLRVYGNLGWQYYVDGEESEASARLLGAADLNASAVSSSSLGQGAWHGRLGVEAIMSNGFTAQLVWRQEEADEYSTDAMVLKLSMPL